MLEAGSRGGGERGDSASGGEAGGGQVDRDGPVVKRSGISEGGILNHGVTCPAGPAAPPDVVFSNLTKTFWPDDGYTKGDLIDYYRTISPWMLPYLADRPVVLTRYPDGIAGKSFFQKDAPGFVPDWIRTERMWSEQAEREIDYFVCDDEASLLYLINMGTIPLHVWASRTSKIDRPDWCVLDLDPKDAPFSDVIKVAQAHARTVRRDRSAQCGEDQRLVRSSRADSTWGPVQLRRGAKPGRVTGPVGNGRAAGDLDCHPAGLPPGWEGLYRLSPDRCGTADRCSIQRAAASRRAGLYAAPLGRSEAGPGYSLLHDQDRTGQNAGLERDPLREVLEQEPDLAAPWSGWRNGVS